MTNSSSKFVAIVYAAYSFGQYTKGDVISRHKSYELANRAAKRHAMSSFLGIKFI